MTAIPEGCITGAGSSVENSVENVENTVETFLTCEKPI